MRAPLTSMSTPTGCTGCADEGNENVVDRRTVLSKGMMAAVAAVLATPLIEACAHTGTSTAASPEATPMGTWALRVKPSDFPELASSGGIARVDGTSDKPVALVRNGDAYVAFSLKCPHAGQLVQPTGKGDFLCTGHGAQFGPDGVWKGGHQAKNLKQLAVTNEGGIITIIG